MNHLLIIGGSDAGTGCHFTSQRAKCQFQAHLQIKPLLEPEQIACYNNLRGYTTSEPSQPIHQQHSH